MTLWLLTRMAVELAALSYKPLFFVVVGTVHHGACNSLH